MTKLEEFYQNDADRTDVIIRSFYEKYKEFINCDNLPVFIIQYVDGREDETIYYQILNVVYHEPIILFCNIAVIDFSSYDFQVLLVHEFTHIYDYYIQKEKYDFDFIRNNFSMYSEYHAVQIETLYQFNLIKNISDEINIQDKDKLSIEFIKKISRYYDNFYLSKQDDTKINFIRAIKSYLYASGAISIANQIFNLNIEMEDFFEPHKELMHEAIKLLWSVKYNEIPSKDILTKIGEINQQITYIE